MDVNTLIESICAVHLSSYVESPYEDRGGLMLVGPPGALKSTMVSVLERQYSDAIMLSDINARTLNDLRDQIAQQSIRTLVLPELQKLYERHPYTASNVEGTLRALAGEGFAAASFEDQRVQRLRARATVISAMTPSTVSERFKAWESSGFNRRFLWALVRVQDVTVLDRALYNWQKLNFRMRSIPQPPVQGRIPNLTTKQEREQVRQWVRYQPGGSPILQAQVLAKMLAVLKWWYREIGDRPQEGLNVIRAFVPALGREGTTLELPEPDAEHKAVRKPVTKKKKRRAA